MTQPRPRTPRIIELRKYLRIPTPSGALFSYKRLTIPVRFEGDVEGEGTLLDLSIGGCRILTEIPLTVGERYFILQVSKEGKPINIDSAIPRWTVDLTSGVKFVNIQPTDEHRLRELLLEIRRPAD